MYVFIVMCSLIIENIFQKTTIQISFLCLNGMGNPGTFTFLFLLSGKRVFIFWLLGFHLAFKILPILFRWCFKSKLWWVKRITEVSERNSEPAMIRDSDGHH